MRRKQGKRRLSITLGSAFVLCVLLGGYAAFGRTAESSVETAPTERVPTLREQLEEKAQSVSFDEQGVWQLLLVGADAADEDETQRSDSMMLLTLDRTRERLVLTSLMRDIYCAIPDHGASRLNHAYMWGGIELLQQTLGQNFGMAADNYLLVDFEGFCAAVDALGGVEIDLDAQEAEYLGLPQGVQRLDGETALDYARVRAIGNADYDRTARQRNVIAALFERVKQLPLRSLYELAQSVRPMVQTDLRWTQLLSLALDAQEYAGYEMTTLRIPIDGTICDKVVDGMMVLDIDFEANRRAWRTAVYGENGAAG